MNARYFLGQSYKKVGRTSDALVQYNILAKVLPDNQDVKDAISSINSPQQTTTKPSDSNVKPPLPEKK